MSLHFKPSEFWCKCKNNCKKEVTKFATRIILEMLHAYLLVITPGAIKIRIVVISGIRCGYWNNHKDVGGSEHSHHLVNYGGDAADIKCYALYDTINYDFKYGKKKLLTRYWSKINPKIIHHFLDKLFPGSLGLGLYDRFNHIDPREDGRRWKG